jgi:hypothetical protein
MKLHCNFTSSCRSMSRATVVAPLTAFRARWCADNWVAALKVRCRPPGNSRIATTSRVTIVGEAGRIEVEILFNAPQASPDDMRREYKRIVAFAAFATIPIVPRTLKRSL